MGRLKFKYLLILSLVTLYACNALKFVPEGEWLYAGSEANIEKTGNWKGINGLVDDIDEALGSEPNYKIFGMRPGLWAYYKQQTGDSNFIVRKIYDKYGEKPVYLSDIDIEGRESVLLNRCENNGFFYADAHTEVFKKKKTASLENTIIVSEPYTVETYSYVHNDIPLDTMIERSLEKTEEPLIRQGSTFNLDKMTEERKRIDAYLKDNGYYNFNAEYLLFTSDTNQYEQRKYDLYLELKNQTPTDGKIPYQLRNIYVYPDHTMQRRDAGDAAEKTKYVDNVAFIQKETFFKPELLRDYLTFKPSDFYNKTQSQITSERLSSIGIYQFVSIRNIVIDSLANDSLGVMDTYVYLSPSKKRSLRLEAQGFTKSTGFTGPGISASYKNKNLFNGGEILGLSGSFSYETQISNNSAKGLSSYQFQLQNSLTFPRLIAPVHINPRLTYSVPKTSLTATYSLQDRAQYYRLNSIQGRLTYGWRSSRFFTHQLSPLSIIYSKVGNETSAFQEVLAQNEFLVRSFDDQFIPGLNYSLVYSDLGVREGPNLFYFNLNADIAGSVLSLSHNALGAKEEILGLPYAQYIKLDGDLRHYMKVTKSSKLVSRIFLGVGIPYGNSTSLPYIKQYFSGGPNSIRAFNVRSLGPGSYQPDSEDSGLSFFDQAGDIRFEVNTEYRFPIFSMITGAVFADAGNIWLIKENEDLPGGKINGDWYKELAVGSGFGLRVDASVLVIRLDIAFPIHYSAEQDSGGHWQQFDFKNKWMRNNLVWNFAIGYPF